MVTHGNALIDAMILRHHGLPYLGFLTGMTMLTALLWGLVGVCIALISLNKGKTLLFKVICGYLKPDAGQVFIQGQRLGKVFNFPPSLGMILETPGFIMTLSARQNLELLWSLRGKPDKEAIARTLDLVGLCDVGRKKVGAFSLGMRQRLGIAQAIMERPELLILDEPFNGLDKQGVKDIRALLKEQRKHGATILLSSHIAGDIEDLCDTVHEMDAGVISPVEV